MYRAVRSYADVNYEVGLFHQELIAWCMLVPFYRNTANAQLTKGPLGFRVSGLYGFRLQVNQGRRFGGRSRGFCRSLV